MLNTDLLMDLTNLFGPPGFEYDVVAFLKKRLGKYPHIIDRSGNMIFEKVKDKGLPNVLIDAHTDECGFIINHITKNGYLQVMPLGGLFAKNTLGHTIVFRTQKGMLIRGIVSTIPVHIEKYQNPSKEITFNDLFIDVGAVSKAEATDEMGLAIGDPGVFDTVSFDQHNAVFGKGMDDRAGCFVLTNLIEYFFNNDCDCDYNLYFSFSVQEEYGLIGIMKIINRVKPDLLIALEGTTGSDLPNLPENLTPCYPGMGPCITIADQASILSGHIRQKIESMNTEAKWHYKRPIFGVTNTAGIHRLGYDTYGLTVSAPCRSIHSAVSSVRKDDLNNAFFFVRDFLRQKNLFD